MCDRKSQPSHQPIILAHGKPSKDRALEPSMYQILSWANPDSESNHHYETNQVEECPISHSMVVQKVQQPQRNINQQQGHNNCKSPQPNKQQILTNNQKKQTKADGLKISIQQSSPKSKNMHMCMNQTNDGFDCKKKTLRPHEVKDQLYMYEEAHLKRSKSQCMLKSPKGTQRLKSKPTPRKLNQNDPKDKEIIQRRKEKIKEFNRLTRDLPNSAFTTYYGKPAFETYGRCSSHHGMKTHNVMPQKGQNNPKTQECYTSALLHGKKIKNEIYLPRKPLQTYGMSQKYPTEQSQSIHLPLQKPDLINHVRFSDPDYGIKKKASVPCMTNTQKKQLNKKYTFASKQKVRKQKKGRESYNDGLKYMNNRSDLLAILQARKTKQSKLAYKVTECYPEGWPHHQGSLQKQELEDTAAGKKYVRSDSAKKVIYRID